jgi:hypothetical protein
MPLQIGCSEAFDFCSCVLEISSDWHVRAWIAVVGISVIGHPLSYDDKRTPTGGVQTEAPAKRRRVWTEAERCQHKTACTGKQKLTYGQKMEIIRRHESTDSEEHRTQAQLAEMFNKSRSAISKILRPEAMDRIKATAAAGIDHAVKRYFPPEHPELERRLFQRIEATCRKQEPGNKGNYVVASPTLCSMAETIAKEMGVDNFKPTAGWYSRFVKRYGLSKPSGEDPSLSLASDLGQHLGQGPIMSVNGGTPSGMGSPTHAMAASRPVDSGVVMPIRNTRQVNFKATWQGQVTNTRRLEVMIDVDENSNMIGGFEATMNLLRQTFQQELTQSQARVSYKVCLKKKAQTNNSIKPILLFLRARVLMHMFELQRIDACLEECYFFLFPSTYLFLVCVNDILLAWLPGLRRRRCRHLVRH